MRFSKAVIGVFLALGSIGNYAQAINFQSAVCGAMMKLVGDRSRQAGVEETLQTVSAVESISAFRQKILQSSSGKSQSYNLAVESDSATAKAKEKVSRQLLQLENRFQAIEGNQLSLFNDASTKPEIISGLHFEGAEVSEFLSDLSKTNDDFRGMTWKARLDFYKRWYGLRTLKKLSPYIGLTILPFILKAFHLDHSPNQFIDIADGIATLGGLYGGVHMFVWGIGPPLFVLSFPATLDYKYSTSMNSFNELISNPRENGWAFASANENVSPDFLKYFNGTNNLRGPIDQQAPYEAVPTSGQNLKQMPVEIAQLLTFKTDSNGQAYPVLDVVVHMTKSVEKKK